MNGKIKFYKEDKGYGFLRNEKGGDAFFHIKDYTIKDGELPTLGTSVTYDVLTTHKGLKAINVTPVD